MMRFVAAICRSLALFLSVTTTFLIGVVGWKG